MSTPSRITELRAENVKRLVAVQINPRGNLVEISGRNGQGKSSVLDSIAMALGGKAWQGAKPIREGAKTGEINVTLDDGTVITRKITEAGGTLTIKSPDGAKYPSPQAMLDKLVGQLTFDPLEFVGMKPVEQRDLLKKLVGVDTSELDKERAATYQERTVVNRDVTRLEGVVATLRHDADAPAKEVSVAELMTKLSEGEAANKSADDALRQFGFTRETEAKWAAEVDRLTKQLAETQKLLESAKADVQRADAAASEARGKKVDVAPIREQIAQSENINQRVRANAERAKLLEQLRQVKAQADQLSTRIEKIDADKIERLASAKFPVTGLSFDDAGVKFNGLPFEQASSAEQIRVSVAMGLAMNPALKVLLIRNGSLLDDNALALVADMAEKADAQVWVERVDSSGAVGIVIEDGMVKTVNEPAADVAVADTTEPVAAAAV